VNAQRLTAYKLNRHLAGADGLQLTGRAVVIIEPADQDGRLYSRRDPQGSLWNFGADGLWLTA
jgi:hypothetical protein